MRPPSTPPPKQLHSKLMGASTDKALPEPVSACPSGFISNDTSSPSLKQSSQSVPTPSIANTSTVPPLAQQGSPANSVSVNKPKDVPVVPNKPRTDVSVTSSPPVVGSTSSTQVPTQTSNQASEYLIMISLPQVHYMIYNLLFNRKPISHATLWSHHTDTNRKCDRARFGGTTPCR